MRRLHVQHDVTGACVQIPTLKCFLLLSIQGNANNLKVSSKCSAWVGVICAKQANRGMQMPIVLVMGCLGCIFDQELVEPTVSFIFLTECLQNALLCFPNYFQAVLHIFTQIQELLMLQALLVKAVVGMGKSRSILGWQKKLWQLDLSAESLAGCCSYGMGGLGLMEHWLVLPQQPCASIGSISVSAEAASLGLPHPPLSVSALSIWRNHDTHQKVSETLNLFSRPVHLLEQDY